MTEIEVGKNTGELVSQGLPFPSLIEEAGDNAKHAFVKFFLAELDNHNTRLAYARAVYTFLAWCEGRGLTLEQVDPLVVSAYVRARSKVQAPTTVKQHLAALRRLFDYLYVERVMSSNPASPVRGPKYSVTTGKTPVLQATDAWELITAIETDSIIGLRDRALIGVMLYSFARVSAVIKMKVEDYFQTGKRQMSFRLHEKGGKHHVVVAHHQAAEYLDAYIESAGIDEDKKGPLFRSANRRTGQLTGRAIDRENVFRMIKKRARLAGLSDAISPHSLRGTGITTYLENNGALEIAQRIAAHSDPRTTKLYDRRADKIDRGEIEKIRFEPEGGYD